MEINYTFVPLMHYLTATCMFGISSLIATIKEGKMHPEVHSANSIKLAHYSHVPALTLIESGWDFSFLYLMNFPYFRYF